MSGFEKNGRVSGPKMFEGFLQREIFRKRNAPITVMTQANPPITMKQRSGFI